MIIDVNLATDLNANMKHFIGKIKFLYYAVNFEIELFWVSR